jgi:hypothetical protein
LRHTSRADRPTPTRRRTHHIRRRLHDNGHFVGGLAHLEFAFTFQNGGENRLQAEGFIDYARDRRMSADNAPQSHRGVRSDNSGRTR